MKKILSLVIAVLLIVLAIALVSCDDSKDPVDQSGNKGGTETEAPENAGSAKISVKKDDGTSVVVGVDEDKDLASYVIVRDDNASSKIKTVVSDLRKAILEKTDIGLNIKTSTQGVSKGIVVALDKNMGTEEFSITTKDGKIYIKAGTEEVLAETANAFVKNFIYGKNKSVLVPAGKGYLNLINYYFDSITIDGTPISEFEVMADKSLVSGIDDVMIAEKVAEALNPVLAEASGYELNTASGRIKDDGHYIFVNVNSTKVNDYSIKIENGNVYLTGSYYSVQAAAKALVTDLAGYTAGSGESGKTANLTSADSKNGSAGLTVPYTKAELLQAFVDANERDDMIISGTHVWQNETSKMPLGNGYGIENTLSKYEAKNLDPGAIIELDIGYLSSFEKDEERLLTYDLSRLVSNAMEHVSKGGIISICAHWANPYGAANVTPGQSWYKGWTGGEDGYRAVYTEGTEANKGLKQVMDTTVALIKALDENGVPFLFRPLHECNGDWFWWCVRTDKVDGSLYIDLWRYVHDYITNDIGVKDILWVYAPGGNGGSNTPVLDTYPGDDYVDIVGIDWYTSGKLEYNNGNGYTDLMATGKPIAITEFGPAENDSTRKKQVDGSYIYFYDCESMLADMKSMLAAGHKLSYFSTWTWSRSIAQLSGNDVLLNDPIIYTRSDMMEYWKNN